tara:strand:+ start:54 stop:1121 length:1068 start_codon:yes stop_codon:yes gene_type:complete
MAYTDIDDPSEYFQVALYTGNQNANVAVVNGGNSDLQPDWVWGKNRDGDSNHWFFDSSRGATKMIQSDQNNVEEDQSGVTAFNSDGFTLGDWIGSTKTNDAYVAWQWKANGGTATATISESGNNPAAVVQANATAGFSMIAYTGTGAAGTIAHGLGVKPSYIIIKNRDATEGWIIDSGLVSGNANGTLHFNTDAEYTDGTNQFGTHTNSVISIKTAGNINTNDQKYIAYVFANKAGYSKSGIMIGNNNNNGRFVYLGFKPAFLLVKNISTANANHDWIMFDNAREVNNEIDTFVRANESTAEATSGRNEIDFLSNGFKARASYGDFNGGTQAAFIYLAFAENPFVSSEGVPTTAR